VEWDVANESAIHSGGKISDSQLGRASLASSDADAISEQDLHFLRSFNNTLSRARGFSQAPTRPED